MRLLPKKMGVGVVAATLVASAVPAQASGFPCFEESSMQSARIHDLRVMLMVNALKCRQVSPTTFRHFGRLLDERSDELAFHEGEVEQAMVARYGPHQGKLLFRNYETRIGNYHSSTHPSTETCQDVSTFIKLASRADHGELETLSKLATNRSIRACAVPESAGLIETGSADWTAPEPAPVMEPGPVQAAVQEVATASEEPQMVDGIPTYMTPGTGPDTSPEPLEAVNVPAAVETVAVEDTSAADPRDEKLAQAITALDAAAAALRDMQSGGVSATN